MGQFGTCAGGCGEQKLELVPAGQYDRVAALASSAHLRAEGRRRMAAAADDGRTLYRPLSGSGCPRVSRYAV